jgi:hypothetical protein
MQQVSIADLTLKNGTLLLGWKVVLWIEPTYSAWWLSESKCVLSVARSFLSRIRRAVIFENNNILALRL